MHLKMSMVNVQTCTHVIQITVRCKETNSFVQLTIYEKVVLIKSLSLKASNIGSIFAPNSFCVNAKLSRFSTACFSSGSRMSDTISCCFLVQAMLPEGFPFHQFHFWKCVRMFNVEGHSHMACTSSSWWTQLQWWHSLFSRNALTIRGCNSKATLAGRNFNLAVDEVKRA